MTDRLGIVVSGANGMKAGDRVVNTLTGQQGVAREFLQDGEADVRWDDGSNELIKWRFLRPAAKALHSGPIKAELFDGTLNGYQRAAQTTAIYPGKGTFWGLMYVNAKCCGEAGEFSEKVGKLMRDKGMEPFDTRKKMEHSDWEALVKEIGDELWYLAAKCTELGITLGEAAAFNIEKLQDRQRRGVLSGSGDNR